MPAALSAPDLTLSAPLLTVSRVLLIAASAFRLVFDDKSSFYQIQTKVSIKRRSEIFTVSLAQSAALFAASILNGKHYTRKISSKTYS